MPNNDVSVDIYKLPNPGNLLFLTVLVSLVPGLLIISASGLIGLSSSLRLSGYILNNNPFLLSTFICLNLYSVVGILFPITSTLLAIAVFLVKPFYFQLRYSPYKVDSETETRFKAIIENQGVVLPVNLLTSNKMVASQIYDIRSPKILISQYNLKHFSKDQINAIIVHEIAHLQNKDLFVLDWAKTAILSFFLHLCVLVVILVYGMSTFLGSVLKWGLARYVAFDSKVLGRIGSAIINTDAIILFIPILCIVALFLCQQAVSTLRERRADIRVRFYSPEAYRALIQLVSKGTRKPDIFESLFESGEGRWTRHESILDPRRLLSPPPGFVALFGVITGIVTGYVYGFKNVLLESLNLSTTFPANIQLVLISPIMLFVILFEAWLIINLLSMQIVERFRIRDFVRVVMRFWLMNLLLVLCWVLTLLVVGYPWSSASGVMYFLFLPFNPLVLSVFFFAIVIQSLFVDQYLITPVTKRYVSIILVYFPLAIAVLGILSMSITKENLQILVSNSMSSLTGHFDFAAIVREDFLLDLQFFRNHLAESVFRGLLFMFSIWAFLFILDVDLDVCCCCGTEAKGPFSLSYMCANCGYPLGAWFSVEPQPSFEKYSYSGSRFDWKSKSIFVLKEKLYYLSVYMAMVASAVASFDFFSSEWARNILGNTIVRLFLGLVSFTGLSIILFVAITAGVAIFGKDFMRELNES